MEGLLRIAGVPNGIGPVELYNVIGRGKHKLKILLPSNLGDARRQAHSAAYHFAVALPSFPFKIDGSAKT
jgi:hypothetical protein